MNVSGGATSQTGAVAATVPTFQANNTHTGTVTFAGTHGFNVTAGNGFQFNNADGTYNFQGAVTLNGGDAGIDVTNDSAGTFTWAATSSITNPSGTGLNVDTASAPTLTFGGPISKNSAGAPLNLANLTGGSVTVSGTITGTAASGGTVINACTGGGTISLGTVNLGASGARLSSGFSVNACNALTLTVTSLTAFTNASAALVLATNTGGSLTVSGGSLDTTASRCVFVNTSPCTLTLTSATSTNSTDEGLRFDTATGAVTITTTTATNAALEGIRIANGNTNFSFGATTITRSAANGTAEGLDLTSNTGTTTFTSLSVDTSAGNQPAIFATSSGTLTINGTTNVIDAGNGRGVDIDNTALSVTLRSVTSDDAGGTLPGIDLNATTGTFTVTGVGTTAGSGGVISTKTGADSSPPTVGVGVVLQNATNVILNNMMLRDFTNWGIWAQTLANFELRTSTVTATGATTNGDNAAASEGSILLNGLTGTVTIDQCTIEKGELDNLRVINSSGVLTAMNVTNSTIGLNGTANGGDGIRLDVSGAAQATWTANNNTFNGARSHMIEVTIAGSAQVTTTITNNTMRDTHTNKDVNGNAVRIRALGGAAGFVANYTISNQVAIAGTAGNPIGADAIDIDFSAATSGTVTGTVNNNVIGEAGVTDSGNPVQFQTGGAVAHTLAFTNNTMRQVFDNLAGGAIRFDNSSTATVNAQLSGNDLAGSTSATNNLRHALLALHTSTGTSCFNLQNNVLDGTNFVAASNAILLLYSDATFAGRYSFSGYAGSPRGETAAAGCGGPGTASVDLATHLTPATGTNTLTNGPVPPPIAGTVDAQDVCNTTNTGTCP